MRLQHQFGLLFAVLGLTTAASVGVAAWGMRFLERELSWPLQSLEEVMSRLHGLKRAVEDQSAAIGFQRGSGASLLGEAQSLDNSLARAEFDAALKTMIDELSTLDQTSSYLLRSGVSNARNLQQRAEHIGTLASDWFESQQTATRAELGLELGTMHELIERLEGRILADARLAVDHGQQLRGAVSLLILASALVVLLVMILAVLLVRRSVVHPVVDLQDAARRLGSGDLTYRLEPVGASELKALGSEINSMASLLSRLQDERVERERLAAMGEMTRRIVHNLRKPLSGIRALAETTRAELTPESDLVQVQDRIIRAVDRFEEWLRDMLRASTPLALELEPVEIQHWLGTVLEAHRPQAESRSIELRLSTDSAPQHAVFDPRHLGHALSAVLSNAIDFAPDKSAIDIQATSDNAHWTLRVRDTGPGIPDDQIDAIFRPFYTTRPTGTGIGLAITRRVLEQHGGTARVQPRSEGPPDAVGTVFELRLPLQPLANTGHTGDTFGHLARH